MKKDTLIKVAVHFIGDKKFTNATGRKFFNNLKPLARKSNSLFSDTEKNLTNTRLLKNDHKFDLNRKKGLN